MISNDPYGEWLRLTPPNHPFARTGRRRRPPPRPGVQAIG
ncbi:hypothetical protein FHR34_004084 [Kitasatospora kifunensis]|uniref:Uncharacterized protein n=1 Tax=Kitasatospora kifunensis TaxID=58351 RepID=A0A7W7R580_KITKI|nr:hypothetical protein [Kitasatospora kifunensis]